MNTTTTAANRVTDSPLEKAGPVSVLIPDFDCWQDREKLVLQGDLPGLEIGDIQIEFHEGVLTVKGSAEHPPLSQTQIRHEFPAAQYERRFKINADIQSDAIEARLDNGVLTLTLPIIQQPGPRRIPVQKS